MHLIARWGRYRLIALSALIALAACWLTCGSLLTILTEPLLIIWLVVSSAIVYSFLLYWSTHWSDLSDSAAAPNNSTADDSAVENAAPVQPGDGSAFYCRPGADRPLRGRVSFHEGVLQFVGEAMLLVDLCELPSDREDGCQLLLSDCPDAAGLPPGDVPYRQVRLITRAEREQPLATFLMPASAAQALQEAINRYLQQRRVHLGQHSRLFLSQVREVAELWRQHGKSQAIAQAFLQRIEPSLLLNPELVMATELWLRDSLPDGRLGEQLFWTSACQVAAQASIPADRLPERVRAFCHDAFQLYVRLLVKDSPPPECPFLVYLHAGWLLLRETACAYYAAALWSRIRPVGRSSPTSFSLSSVLEAYVAKHDEAIAHDPACVLQLSYLLVHLGLMSASVVYPEIQTLRVWDQTKNPLLLQDTVRLHISQAWEQAQLERFERELFRSQQQPLGG